MLNYLTIIGLAIYKNIPIFQFSYFFNFFLHIYFEEKKNKNYHKSSHHITFYRGVAKKKITNTAIEKKMKITFLYKVYIYLKKKKLKKSTFLLSQEITYISLNG